MKKEREKIKKEGDKKEEQNVLLYHLCLENFNF